MPKNAYEERIELLEKAIISLVGRTAMDELDELNAHPDLEAWAEHWLEPSLSIELQSIIDAGEKKP